MTAAARLPARTLLFTAVFSALLATAAVASAQGDSRRSGFADMTPAVQALQRDDAQNPAWLWLKGGEERFAADCARCHTLHSLRGAAPRYPAWDTHLG